MSDSQKMEQLAQEVLSRHDAGEGKVVATPVPEDGSTPSSSERSVWQDACCRS